jgi:hypothetical protein
VFFLRDPIRGDLMALRICSPSSRSWLILMTAAVIGVVGLLGPATSEGAVPPKAADNPRVTRAAFDAIQWQMPSQAIERILGKGEPVASSVVLHAMGSQPGDTREPFDRVEQGLWLVWQGKDQTIFVQFGGPTVVQNPDGSYSVGPNTESALVLFVTENSSTIMRMRDIRISYKLGPRHGEIRVVRS